MNNGGTNEVAAHGRPDPAGSGATRRRVGREVLGGLVVAFLLCGPYLSQFLRAGSSIHDVVEGRNAMWFLWQPHDPFGLLGCLLAAAVMLTLVRELLRAWCPRGFVRVFDHAFVIALGAGILTNVWFHTQRPHGYRIGQFGMEMQTAWLAMFAAAGYSLASPRSRLVHRCAQLCQVVSPGILIVAYQLMQLPTLARPMDALTAVPPAVSSPVPMALAGKPADRPVYLFIFDEWSYPRTYEQGRCRSFMPRLAEFSRQATTFHNAHSPGPRTYFSIPLLLRGTPDSAEIRDFKPGFLRDGAFVPAAEYPSIFTRSGCGDYRKIMVHYGFATWLWAADELDVTRGYSFYVRGDNALGDAAAHGYNAAYYWTDPWTTWVRRKITERIEDNHFLGMYREMDADIHRIIHDQPARTFAIVHYPVPHPPFILDGEGVYRGRELKPEGYERNLAYLDRVIDRIIGELKSAGRYDDAMLILTSDHSWRRDPIAENTTEDKLTHVPLIIKLPGQTEPVEVNEDFRMYRLGEFIARGLGHEPAQPPVALAPR